MDRPDDRYEAVLRVLLGVCDPEAPVDEMAYEAVLRRIQALLVATPAPSTEAKPPPIDTPEKAQAVREAVSRLDPRAGDQHLDEEALLPRLAAVVDKEVFKWTSSLVQPPGPSGEIATSPPPPVEEAAAARG